MPNRSLDLSARAVLAMAALSLTTSAMAAPRKAAQPQFLPITPLPETAVSPPPPPPLTPMPRPFDPKAANLEGIGYPAFVFDGSKFENTLSGNFSLSSAIRLWLNDSGRPLGCESLHGVAGAKNVAEACRQLMASARLDFDPAFVVPFERGYLDFNLVVRRTLKPALPVVFTNAGHGHSITINLSLTTPGGHCQVWDDDISESDGKAICQAFMATSAARTRRFSNGKAMTGKSVAIAASIKPRLGVPLSEASLVSEDPDQTSYPVYPDPVIAESQMLGLKDGRVVSAITSDDYPLRAMRAELGGNTKVVLAIDGIGSVRGCRPVQSSGHALLDNFTCVLAPKRLRFEFLPGEGGFEGLRYIRSAVRWVIPE